MFLEHDVLPVFRQWVESLPKVVPMSEAKRYGRHFVSSHIPAERVASRGEVYEFFEKVCSYAEMSLLMYKDMPPDKRIVCENMYNIAQGIVWAVEHDGFDSVKWEPLPSWGGDIMAMQTL